MVGQCQRQGSAAAHAEAAQRWCRRGKALLLSFQAKLVCLLGGFHSSLMSTGITLRQCVDSTVL